MTTDERQHLLKDGKTVIVDPQGRRWRWLGWRGKTKDPEWGIIPEDSKNMDDSKWIKEQSMSRAGWELERPRWKKRKVVW